MPLLTSVAANAAVASQANPNLDARCGIDIALIIDRSGSIGNNNTNVQQAAQGLVNALVGTGSKVQVVSFSGTATGGTGTDADINHLGFVDPAGLTIPAFTSSGLTNWDDALEMTRRSPGGIAPLTFMITDGDPTTHNDVTPDGHGGSTSTGATANLDNAVTEANLLRAHPSHMFVVGVGAALTSSASVQRIKDISGPDALTFTGSTPNIPFGTADYTLVTSFSDLKTSFAHFARELCGPGVNVVKHLQPSNGGPAVIANGQNPFSYTATVNPTPASWQNPTPNTGAAATLVTGANGAANFKWEPNPATANSGVTMSEAAVTGWVPNGQTCWLNKLDGSPLVNVLDNVGTNTSGASKPAQFSIPGGIDPDYNVNCDVYNRQLRTSTVSVQKATSPAGRPETFSFHLKQNGNDVATATGLADTTPAKSFGSFLPGTYTVTEDAANNFSATGATCDNTNTQTAENASPVNLAVGEQQAWLCTFTNTAANGTIRIVKAVDGAPGGTFGFTSTIPNHTSFSLSPANDNNASVDFPVAPLPNGTYAVAESSASPFSLASASCSDNSPIGAISVSPGELVTCTFTNAAPAPTIAVTKTPAVGSVAEPGTDVIYTVTVHNSALAPLTLTQLTDSIGGGPAINVFSRPGTCSGLLNSVIAIGGTLVCTFSAPVAGDAGQTVNDIVTAKTADAYGHTPSGTATAAVGITDVAPTITATKTPDVTTIAEPGGPVTFTVAVTNSSNEAVTLTSLTDTVGGSTFNVTQAVAPVTATTCGLVPIAAHATYTCHFTVPVTGSAGNTGGTVVPDTVHAQAIDNDGSSATADAASSVRITDVKPSLEVTKTGSTGTVNEPGGNVTFTVTIHNTSVEPLTITSIDDRVGGGPAVNVTSIAGNTCGPKIGSTLAAGASTTCTFPMSVTGNAGASISDTVTVHGHDDEQNDATGADTATVRVNDVAPSLQVSKSAGVASVNEPGAPVTYTVTVHNTSVEPVTITAVSDAVGAGAPFDVTTLPGNTCGALVNTTLAIGGSASCQFSIQVSGDAGANVVDTAKVTAHDDDGNTVSGTAQATVHVNDVAPSMTVTKTASQNSVPEPGADVTYTVSVHNTSVESITLMSLTDKVGAGAAFPVTGVTGTTCAFPQSIAIGASYACTFTQHVSGDAGAVVNDTVTAAAHDNDGNQITADGSASVHVTDVQPTIAVSKVAASTSVAEPGADVTYTVTVHNTSVESVTVTSLTDKVGGGAAFPVTGVTGTTCVLPHALAIGASYSCTFTQHVTGDASDVVSDTVTAIAHDNEQNEANGEGTESVNVTDVDPSMTVSKTASTTSVSEPGANVTYTVAVHNTSVEALTLTDLEDKVGTAAAFDITGVAGTTCSLPQTIAIGATYSCTFVQHVTGDAGDVVGDTVTATAHDNEDNDVIGEGSESVNVTDVPPTGTVTKTASSASVPEPGAPVEFNVIVHNSSIEPVTITALTDKVGAGAPFSVTAVTGLVTATTCTNAIGKVLAVGADYTCHFTLAVLGNGDGSVTDLVAATLQDNEHGTVTPTDDSTVTVTDVLPTIVVTKTTTAGTVDAPGGVVPFTVTVTNTSPEPVTVDSITDAVAGLAAIDVTHVAGLLTATTCVTGGVLAAAGSPGSTLTCQFSLVVSAANAATFPDIVTASAHDDENNHVSDDAGASAKVNPVADLSIDKTVTQELVAGGVGAYNLAVHNDGPSAAEAIVVTDTLPTGVTATTAGGTGWACSISADAGTVVCTRAALAAGATASIAITVNAAASLNGQSVTNVGTVGSTTKDDDPSNNRDSVTSAVSAIAVLPLVLARTGARIALLGLSAIALLFLGMVVVKGTEVLPTPFQGRRRRDRRN
jgi:uncharacterized repeat protein (TIGR01451 family)